MAATICPTCSKSLVYPQPLFYHPRCQRLYHRNCVEETRRPFPQCPNCPDTVEPDGGVFGHVVPEEGGTIVETTFEDGRRCHYRYHFLDCKYLTKIWQCPEARKRILFEKLWSMPPWWFIWCRERTESETQTPTIDILCQPPRWCSALLNGDHGRSIPHQLRLTMGSEMNSSGLQMPIEPKATEEVHEVFEYANEPRLCVWRYYSMDYRALKAFENHPQLAILDWYASEISGDRDMWFHICDVPEDNLRFGYICYAPPDTDPTTTRQNRHSIWKSTIN